MNKISDIDRFYDLFPVPELARDLTNILEDYRIESRLKAEYPALGDQISEVNLFFLSERPLLDELCSDKERAVEVIGQRLISGKTNEQVPDRLREALDYALSESKALDTPRADIHEVARIATELYFFIDETFRDAYEPVNPFSPFLDQSKYNQYVGDSGSASGKSGRAPDDQTKNGTEATNEGADGDGIVEPQEEEDQPRLSDTQRNKRNSNIYDFNEVPTVQPSGSSDEPESEDKSKKSLRVIFAEDGVRPNDMSSTFDSIEPNRLGDRSIGLTSFVPDRRELESEECTYLYPEWGHDIACYRINWSRVREQVLPGTSTEFYEATLEKYAGLIRKVKREFQMLRPEGLVKLRRQFDGDDIDLDATIEFFVDRKLGLTPSEKNYVRTKKSNRDIAVSFLVDMSGSTRGSTIALEKEALVIMSESLCELGDSFSIYGFSGYTRENVSFYIIKEFCDAYDHEIAQRISSIEHDRGTRIGPAIRHTTTKLRERDEKIRMLILLSDGRPEDREYYDTYGIEDTRMALKEAQRYGIRPFCITVDNKAQEYLHRMYSHSNWVVINEISKLPLRITSIYKRLTS